MDNNLTQNRAKCEFSKAQVKKIGLIFGEEGVQPDPEKVEALNNTEAPNNKD